MRRDVRRQYPTSASRPSSPLTSKQSTTTAHPAKDALTDVSNMDPSDPTATKRSSSIWNSIMKKFSGKKSSKNDVMKFEDGSQSTHKHHHMHHSNGSATHHTSSDPNAVVSITSGEAEESYESDRAANNITLENFLCRVGCIDLHSTFVRHNLSRLSDLRVLPLDTFHVLIVDPDKRETILTALWHVYPNCRSSQQRKSSTTSSSTNAGGSFRDSSTQSGSTMDVMSETFSSHSGSTSATELHERSLLIDVLTDNGLVRLLPRLLSNGLSTPQAILNCSDAKLTIVIPQEDVRDALVSALLTG
eukprot:PhF_6_TR42755/c0_g1_i1/m.64646